LRKINITYPKFGCIINNTHKITNEIICSGDIDLYLETKDKEDIFSKIKTKNRRSENRCSV